MKEVFIFNSLADQEHSLAQLNPITKGFDHGKIVNEETVKLRHVLHDQSEVNDIRVATESHKYIGNENGDYNNVQTWIKTQKLEDFKLSELYL